MQKFKTVASCFIFDFTEKWKIESKRLRGWCKNLFKDKTNALDIDVWQAVAGDGASTWSNLRVICF